MNDAHVENSIGCGGVVHSDASPLRCVAGLTFSVVRTWGRYLHIVELILI